MANRLAPVMTVTMLLLQLARFAQGQIDWTQYASSTAGEQTKLEGLATDSSGNYYVTMRVAGPMVTFKIKPHLVGLMQCSPSFQRMVP